MREFTGSISFDHLVKVFHLTQLLRGLSNERTQVSDRKHLAHQLQLHDSRQLTTDSFLSRVDETYSNTQVSYNMSEAVDAVMCSKFKCSNNGLILVKKRLKLHAWIQ